MSDDSKYRQALRTPSETYREPDDVLRDATLDAKQKMEILSHWRSEAIELQESEAEGMAGGERSLLTDIDEAIAKLKAEPE